MTNFTAQNELDGVAVLALTGYVLIVANDEQPAFDSLLTTEVL
ncbi:hypothetical protein [Deinococcus radiotolerans]|uniref:Uncharacterized protein n=1 Tax=Deinococcus radiotolerans TaxID=1309407 RepID=A0ABQ2FN77_9DEIO|nr:hypothetical protein [Deinococcus radiotolerans]GGL10650.1 hypothetical protein GCM10010844_31640 [Deinococcus radiotolerans]